MKHRPPKQVWQDALLSLSAVGPIIASGRPVGVAPARPALLRTLAIDRATGPIAGTPAHQTGAYGPDAIAPVDDGRAARPAPLPLPPVRHDPSTITETARLPANSWTRFNLRASPIQSCVTVIALSQRPAAPPGGEDNRFGTAIPCIGPLKIALPPSPLMERPSMSSSALPCCLMQGGSSRVA